MRFIAALAIFTLPAAAAPFSQSIPITLSLPVPCNNVGEVVDLSGTQASPKNLKSGDHFDRRFAPYHNERKLHNHET